MKKKYKFSLIIKYLLLVITLTMSFFITLYPKALDDFKVTDKIKPLGAQLRLDNFSCISFSFDFSDFENNSEAVESYGVVIAIQLSSGYLDDGKTRSDIFKGVQIQYSETVTIDYDFGGIYSVIVKNTPKQRFDTKFYALGYVNYENGDKVYSDTYLARAITDVARIAYSNDETGPIIGLAIENKLVKIIKGGQVTYTNSLPSEISEPTTIELTKGEYEFNLVTNSDLTLKGLNKENTIISGTITSNSSKLDINGINLSNKTKLVINEVKYLFINNNIINTELVINNNLSVISIDNNIFNTSKALTLNTNKTFSIYNNTFIVNNLNDYVIKNESSNYITLKNCKFIFNQEEVSSSDLNKILIGNIK